MKYALKIPRYEQMANYGDYSQQAAIEHLYEYMGIPKRDIVRLNECDFLDYKGSEYLIVPINSIFNGVYNKLSDRIIPVYLGFSAPYVNAALVDSLRLREFSPVGCRDKYNYDRLRELGVDAWLNGCMTITLPKRADESNANKVYIIDVHKGLLDYIPEHIKRDAVYLTQIETDGSSCMTEYSCQKRYQLLKNTARLVVTSRLHVASPCIAYGISTIVARQTISNRFHWLQSYVDLYDQSNWKNINWDPRPVEFESRKKVVLDNAAKIVSATYDKYLPRCTISESNSKETNINFVHTEREVFIEWIKKHWDPQSKDGRIYYALWGQAQLMYFIYEYITKAYPHAVLCSVIDEYKTFSFAGIESQRKESLLNHTGNITVFIAAIRAARYANEWLADKPNISVCDPYINDSINFLDIG